MDERERHIVNIKDDQMLNANDRQRVKLVVPIVRARQAAGLHFPAREEDGGFRLVEGAGEFEEAALFGDADGGGMVRMNDAERARRGDMDVAPGKGGADGFGGVALAMKLRS